MNNDVQKDLNEVSGLVQQYKNSPDSSKLDRIYLVLNKIDSDLDQVLPSLHITDSATKTKISAAITLALGGIRGLRGLVSKHIPVDNIAPPPDNPPPLPPPPVQTYAAPRIDVAQLKRDYNNSMSASTGVAEVDKAFAKAKVR